VLSAVENVEYVMMLQGAGPAERRRRALEVLELVGLKGMGGRRPAQLSGGEQQRVAVARAIASGPSIILADEPTANLDSETGGTVVALMKELRDQTGITFIISSHDPVVIEKAERLVELRDGRVVSDKRL
jgi:putative ABC transport system ATP-binding protein